MGISDATFYNWKKKYGGLGISELRRLRQLEEENHQLKKLVADLNFDKQMLQDVLKKSSKASAASGVGRRIKTKLPGIHETVSQPGIISPIIMLLDIPPKLTPLLRVQLASLKWTGTSPHAVAYFLVDQSLVLASVG